MMLFSYLSSNLSLIALEIMRLLVRIHVVLMFLIFLIQKSSQSFSLYFSSSLCMLVSFNSLINTQLLKL